MATVWDELLKKQPLSPEATQPQDDSGDYLSNLLQQAPPIAQDVDPEMARLGEKIKQYKQAQAQQDAAKPVQNFQYNEGLIPLAGTTSGQASPMIGNIITPKAMPELKGQPVEASGLASEKPTDTEKEIEDETGDLDKQVEPPAVADNLRKEVQAAPAVEQNPAADTSAMDNAIAQSNRLAGLMMMAKGAERAGAAIARQKSDPNYLHEMEGMINRPVENLLAQQKYSGNKLDLAIKAFNYAYAKDKDNPLSPASQLARNALEAMVKASGMDMQIPKDISASEAKDQFNGIANYLKAKEIGELRLQGIKDRNEAKKVENQNKAYSDLINKVEGNRIPPDVKYAKQNALFVKNALEIPTMFPNPNDIPQDMVNAMRAEIARMATGSTATMGAMQKLDTPTVRSLFQQGLSKLGNKPTGAQLGAFVKNNIKYIQALGKVSNDVIANHQKRMYLGYKERLSPEQQQLFQETYSDAFASPAAPGGIPADRVTVISPDGKLGHIPKAQLQDALKQGYKLQGQ